MRARRSVAEAFPVAYRSLLRTYPAWWRRRNGEVALSTLLDLHADSSRTRPRLGERVAFAADGLRVRLVWLMRTPSTISTTRPALASLHRFDQTNGRIVEVPVSEHDQLHANAFEIRSSAENRIANAAWAGFNMLPHN